MKASKITARPVEWIWQEHIPYGMLSCIGGPPDRGKSTVGIKIVADVTREGIPVWVSSYEEPMAEVIRPKLEAAGADLDLVEVAKIKFPQALRDNSPFRRAVENDGVQMLLMDTISDNTDASIYNVRQIRDAMGPLGEYANETDLAVVAITHSIKKIDPKADPLAAIGGSQGGLNALVRAAYAWGYSADDEDERVLSHLKCNIAARRPSLKFEMDVRVFEDGISAPYLNFLGRTKQQALRTLTALPQGTDPKRLEAHAEWLIETLKAALGSMDEDKIIALAAADLMSVKKLRTAAEATGVTTRKGLWRLPPDPLEANISDPE
jgi:hypothetical protein